MLSLALEDKYEPFTGNDSIHVDKITLPLTISFPFRISKNECTLRETLFFFLKKSYNSSLNNSRDKIITTF